MGVGTIKIQKGWYRTAGHKYGWVPAGYEPEGVGINREALYNNDILRIEVNGQEYTVVTSEAIEFIKRFKSHYAMPGGTKIGVISKTLMVKVEQE